MEHTSVAAPLPVPAVPSRFPRFPLVSPLSVPAYALFWIASILIFVSGNFRDIAGASIALDLTGRPSGLATLQTLGAIPNVAVMLFGGLAADRFRPHRVLLVAMLAHAGIASAIAVLAQLGVLEYWQLIVFSLAGGIAGGLFNGSYFSVLPDLLPGDQLRGGNALTSMTESLARFLIPPLAGLTLAAAGAPSALALGATSAFLAAALLGRMRAPLRQPSGGGATPSETSGVLARLRAGLRAARADGAVWTLIWAGAVLVPGSFGAVAVGVPSLAKLTLAGGDAGLGILFGALGAGALAGALAAGAVRAVGRPGLVIVLGVVGEGAALAGTGLAPTLWIAAAALAVAGCFQAVRIVLAVTVLQSRTAPNVRGRVMSLAVLVAVVPQIAVLGLAGYVGDTLGPPTVMVLGGALVILGGALIASQRSVRALTA